MNQAIRFHSFMREIHGSSDLASFIPCIEFIRPEGVFDARDARWLGESSMSPVSMKVAMR
jgi:hypothetical protein